MGRLGGHWSQGLFSVACIGLGCTAPSRDFARADEFEPDPSAAGTSAGGASGGAPSKPTSGGASGHADGGAAAMASTAGAGGLGAGGLGAGGLGAGGAEGCVADCEPCPSWYRDADGDGRGDPHAALSTCSPPTGYVATDDDCDDADATLVFLDADGDSFGDPETPLQACSDDPRRVTNSDDCNDSDGAVHPGQLNYSENADSQGGFDYDCDGNATPQWSAVAGGNCMSGWGGAVPECGQPGTWVTLTAWERGCNSAVATRVQRCR